MMTPNLGFPFGVQLRTRVTYIPPPSRQFPTSSPRLRPILSAAGHAAIAEAAMEFTDTNAAGALDWFVEH